MSSTAKPFQIRGLDEPGLWYTDVSRYHSWVVGQVQILKEMHARLETEDKDLPEGDILRSSVPPARWSEYLERNMLSDTIVVFSAMTAEAFLNFYGVVRLTETEYSAHFERLGIVPKLRQLLLVCDKISISAKDPLVNTLASLANRRNDLVHPKTKESLADGSMPQRWKRPVLDNAVQAAEELDTFLNRFAALVPASKHLLPYVLRADA